VPTEKANTPKPGQSIQCKFSDENARPHTLPQSSIHLLTSRPVEGSGVSPPINVSVNNPVSAGTSSRPPFRQRFKSRKAEQHHTKDYREQVAYPSEEDDWWTVLEVLPDASLNDIRRSYRRKIQQYHPDRVAGFAPEVRQFAETRSKILSAAYAEAMRERRACMVRWRSDPRRTSTRPAAATRHARIRRV
jgi:hypothetical protein